MSTWLYKFSITNCLQMSYSTKIDLSVITHYSPIQDCYKYALCVAKNSAAIM